MFPSAHKIYSRNQIFVKIFYGVITVADVSGKAIAESTKNYPKTNKEGLSSVSGSDLDNF